MRGQADLGGSCIGGEELLKELVSTNAATTDKIGNGTGSGRLGTILEIDDPLEL